MALYNNAVLTSVGKSLINRVIAGEGELEFAYIKIGTGIYSSEEKKADSIRPMTDLKKTKQIFPFSSVRPDGEDYVFLKANATNIGLDEGYQITELGIFAGIKGESNSVLYCVITTENADYMPDYISEKLYEIIFQIFVKVVDAENVYINFSTSTYALAEDLDIHVRDKENPHGLVEITAEEIEAMYN